MGFILCDVSFERKTLQEDFRMKSLLRVWVCVYVSERTHWYKNSDCLFVSLSTALLCCKRCDCMFLIILKSVCSVRRPFFQEFWLSVPCSAVTFKVVKFSVGNSIWAHSCKFCGRWFVWYSKSKIEKLQECCLLIGLSQSGQLHFKKVSFRNRH